MGLYAFEVDIIAGLMSNLTDRKPLSVLSFGHPDILATPLELKHWGEFTPDNAEVLRERNYHPKPNIIGNAKPLFKALGGELFVIDIRKTNGVDEIGDLNYAIRPFANDIVIDPGTSEHCFNVGQALVNMARCVSMGGYIYHMVPLCHWNHGFWNFSPCAFNDFYEQNGFEVVTLQAEYRGYFQPVVTKGKFEIPTKGRKLNLMCIAKRVKDIDIGFPTQYKWPAPGRV